MLPLKWGDALSMILPGAVALVGLREYISGLDVWMSRIGADGQVTSAALLVGVALLMVATVVGGILEAFTRVGWEKHLLVKKCPLPRGALRSLREKPGRIALYERGVQSSYKWVTAHANTAWALSIVLIARLHNGPDRCSVINAVLLLVVALLLYASYVQWTYFVNYQTQVFTESGEESNAEERSAARN